MNIGMTGTRFGMTDKQKLAVRNLLRIFADIEEFHHGSCMGSDVEAARSVRRIFPKCFIVAHPGPDGDNRRDESGVDDEIREPLTHFARNRNIVRASQRLIATPLKMDEMSHGGTWYTIKYARSFSVPVAVVWPDGKIEIS